MPKRGRGPKAIWAGILAAVPLLGLLWGIWSYYHPVDARVRNTLQLRYFLLGDDELVDFAVADPELMEEIKVTQPRIIRAGLTGKVLEAVSQEAIKSKGRQILSAKFLVVTNAGPEHASNVELKGAGFEHKTGFLGVGETVLLCVKARYVGGTISKAPVNEAVLVSPDGDTKEYPLSEPTDESMQPVLGSGRHIYLGYPPGHNATTP
jgi:hypothetical protein